MAGHPLFFQGQFRRQGLFNSPLPVSILQAA